MVLASAPYRETDATGPVSVYGASKLAGEIGAGGERSGAYDLSHELGVWRARKELSADDPEAGAGAGEAARGGGSAWRADVEPRSGEDDGDVMRRCETAALGRELTDALNDAGGIYHAAGSGETTWHGFAEEAMRVRQEKEPGVRFAEIEAITTAEYPTPAKRPANSRMDCSKLEERFGWRMMDWRESLREVLAEL